MIRDRLAEAVANDPETREAIVEFIYALKNLSFNERHENLIWEGFEDRLIFLISKNDQIIAKEDSNKMLSVDLTSEGIPEDNL